MSRLVIMGIILAIIVAMSLLVGVRHIAPSDYIDAIIAYDPTNPAHVALLSVRVPRMVAGLIAGAALGIAGTVMQAVTRNPLADPGLLGVNAGAAFAILVGTLVMGGLNVAAMTWLAFPGAALASMAVFALGGGLRGDAGPVRLTLAGAALNAFLLSLVTAVVLLRQDSLDTIRFWVAGSLSMAASRPLDVMAATATLGAVIALVTAPRIEALSLGDALARGLGTHPGMVQATSLLAVTLCTGSAVAVAGPIAFLGLLVPPLTRALVGHDMRHLLIGSALIGATVLIAADTLGRIVLAPAEVRVGVMTALIGGPVFIWVARRLRPGAQS